MAKSVIVGSLASPIYVWNDAQLTAVTTVLANDLVGDELSIDQMLPDIYSSIYIQGMLYAPTGATGYMTTDNKLYSVRTVMYPDRIPYGTPVYYYQDGSLVGKFYVKAVKRTSKVTFEMTAVSAVGLMDTQMHMGGVYNGQQFIQVVDDILGNSYAYTCDADVASIAVFGWLPLSTKRENLHQLLFACGVMLRKNNSGDLHFCFVDTNTVHDIAASRVFRGGTVERTTPATSVELTEHTFQQSMGDVPYTLFDNTDGSGIANHQFVSFQQAPCYNLEATGELVIESSGVNYAIVSGTGILTGFAYTHITKVMSQETEVDTEETNVVTVTDATLVNVLNSRNVLRRLVARYSSARTIEQDFILEQERTGDRVSVVNVFEEEDDGYIAAMTINTRSFPRASATIIADYIPQRGGNNYSQVMRITESGEYTLPITEDGEALFVLISGGYGGNLGEAGERGNDGHGWTNGYGGDGVGGEGGQGGTGGLGGKVFSAVRSVTVGQRISAVIGQGGAGATISAAAQEGGATTVLDLTSADGVTPEFGYQDVFTGEVFAFSGEAGIEGGNGSSSINQTINSTPGRDVEYKGVIYKPGNNGANYTNTNSGAVSGGGLGGGAAAGANGGNGADAGHDYDGQGGNGGRGATPVKADNATVYGSGGNGGHGGGGGGGGGGVQGTIFEDYGYGGAGGNGGEGGDGAQGILLIYY